MVKAQNRIVSGDREKENPINKKRINWKLKKKKKESTNSLALIISELRPWYVTQVSYLVRAHEEKS